MNTQRFNTRHFLLLSLLIGLLPYSTGAQGFIREYPFFTWAQGGPQSIFPQADGSFKMTAASFGDIIPTVQMLWLHVNAQGQFIQGDTVTDISQTITDPGLFQSETGGYIIVREMNDSLAITFTTANNNVLWAKMLPPPPGLRLHLQAVRQIAGGEIFITAAGFNSSAQQTFNGTVWKLNAAGEILWQTSYPQDASDWLTFLLPADDGGCVLTSILNDPVKPGAFFEKAFRFNQNGQEIWSFATKGINNLERKKIAVNAAQETLLPGYFSVDGTEPPSSFLYKLDAGGILSDSLNLSDSLELFHPHVRLVFPLNDNGFIVVAQHYLLNAWTDYAIRIAENNTISWVRPITSLHNAFPAQYADGKELPDGNLVLYGFQGDKLFLIKMSPDGVIYPHTLNGRIVRDSTFNCQPDAFDPPLKGWVVSASGNGSTHYAASDDLGNYTLPDLDTGAYQVVLTPPSYLWQPCVDSVQVQFSGTTPQLHTLDFPVQALYDCALLQVDIGVPFLRRCFGNTYTVQYCNAGNQPATEVSIEVTLDALLTVDSASVAYTQAGQTLTFQPGDLAPGECGSFQIYATVSCDAVLGQTLCAEAHIFPDTLCAPNLPDWSGAQVEVSALCDGDSVRFTIRNSGSTAMQQALDFIIVDDHVITRSGVFQLPPNNTHEETVPADGSTWRLIAEQEPGYPFGPQKPAAGVEACTNNPAGGFSMGMLNLFPNYSGNPYHDIDCHPVIGAYDPNDKQAFPEGVHDERHIEKNQPIEYLIRFQNTGTDTAFTVVIRDTLSPWLDPAGIRPGAAGHPYNWSLGGQGILTVTFPNIMLPDSNVNEAASHGFVQFTIDQKRDNKPGTRIQNSADIYFDFNAPIRTNTVFHTVEKDFLLTATHRPAGLPVLNIWPNPAAERLTVQLDRLFRPGQRLILYDPLGRVMQDFPVTGSTPEIRRNGLPAGMYWLELRDKNKVVAVGKAVFGVLGH